MTNSSVMAPTSPSGVLFPWPFDPHSGKTVRVEDDQKPPDEKDERQLPPRVDAAVDRDIGVLSPEALKEKIANRAQQIYENRVREGIHGDEYSDWYIAEREIMERWRSPLHDVGPPVWEESPRTGRNGPEK